MHIPSWLITICAYMEHLASLVVLLPLGLAFWRWRWLSAPLRVLAASLIFTELVLLTSSLISLYRPGWMYGLWHFFTIVQTLLFFRLYYLTLSSRAIRRGIVAVAVAFTAFALLDSLYLEGLHQVNSYTHVAQSALLIGLALLYFEQLLNDLHVTRLERDPLFLVSAAVVLYFSGTVLLYVFMNKLATPADQASQQVINTLNAVVNLIKYFLFALAFWYTGRTPQVSPRI
ncbi:hypothetical protein SAMN02745146_2131 [Hymenobacter daecheongensis DSM 21074]|uniref:YhhN-like protein n=1 Tax=Hymenobacter daecheongensis DSM 21074 TaxID=1121955 RepID=A0A1M6G5Y1_9BACT|nr:hypothetical protein [Hymenobacter daecheongensis]SHJ05344.1 hypothetical protein SAMN02745146_2131 [Hymenobacter daecheongensis DSM 21074]